MIWVNLRTWRLYEDYLDRDLEKSQNVTRVKSTRDFSTKTTRISKRMKNKYLHTSIHIYIIYINIIYQVYTYIIYKYIIKYVPGILYAQNGQEKQRPKRLLRSSYPLTLADILANWNSSRSKCNRILRSSSPFRIRMAWWSDMSAAHCQVARRNETDCCEQGCEWSLRPVTLLGDA